MAGKRAALIGNGSSGAQITAFLAEHADALTVFQRTPQWMAPRSDYRDVVTDAQQWLLANMPYYWNWFVYGQFVAQIGLQKAQEFDSSDHSAGHVNKWNDALRHSLTEYIAHKVGDDPALLEQLLPDYAPLGRRLVVDNGWYDTLRLQHVDLVSSPIQSFMSNGIRTEDGVTHDFDVIVLATGFEVSKYFYPVKYVGRDGATLDDLWAADGPRAYLGMALPGLPNFFCFYGPNGQPRAGGFHFWAESWSRYVGDAIARSVEHGWQSMEVTRSAYDDYNDRLDKAMDTMLWANEGSGSYYVNEFGRPGVNMPWRAESYNAMIHAPDIADYFVTPSPELDDSFGPMNP
jgi:4-hydroxyacetophenone monooxygenase